MTVDLPLQLYYFEEALTVHVVLLKRLGEFYVSVASGAFSEVASLYKTGA